MYLKNQKIFAVFYYCVGLGVCCDSSGSGGHLTMGN